MAYSCSNAYVKRKPGWFFSVSEAPDAVGRVHTDLACNRPLFNLDDQYVQYSAKCAVYNVDYGHLKSLDLARESKTF